MAVFLNLLCLFNEIMFKFVMVHCIMKFQAMIKYFKSCFSSGLLSLGSCKNILHTVTIHFYCFSSGRNISFCSFEGVHLTAFVIWHLLLFIIFCFHLFFQNSCFTVPWLGLKDLANVSKTSLSMLELVKRCCCEQQIPSLFNSSNSYFIFLSILAQIMKEENHGVHPWKQLKGRYGCHLVSHFVTSVVDQGPFQPHVRWRALCS